MAIEASSPQLKEAPTQLVGFGSDTLPRSWFLSRRRGGVVNAYSLQSSHLTISSPLDFTGIACATPELSSHVDGIRPFKRESATRASSYWPDSPGSNKWPYV